ncbi:MAG: heme exporter protein CcmD [Proteobacteria bacterium]|jgi:heme exporter protein CcmD|nr:heme exporter protein CcmD [Pseudomonadota bacterium]
MTRFLEMGGYAWYVWMAYGAVAAVVVAETIALKRRGRRALATARMVQQAAEAGGDSLQMIESKGTR